MVEYADLGRREEFAKNKAWRNETRLAANAKMRFQVDRGLPSRAIFLP